MQPSVCALSSAPRREMAVCLTAQQLLAQVGLKDFVKLSHDSSEDGFLFRVFSPFVTTWRV